MKEYISPITQMIARNGVTVRMAAGVPRPLPELLVPVALLRGVAEVDAPIAPISDAPEGPSVNEVVTAIRQLMESGNPDVFGANGEPKLRPLRAAVGAPVTDALRDAAWAVVKSEV